MVFDKVYKDELDNRRIAKLDCSEPQRRIEKMQRPAMPNKSFNAKDCQSRGMLKERKRAPLCHTDECQVVVVLVNTDFISGFLGILE